MKARTFLGILFLLILGGTINTFAQTAVTVGNQVTSESSLTSGNAYLVYYVGNGNSGYMKDTGSAYTGKDDNNPTTAAVYYFTDNGDGTWKVQNYHTGKYWGTPTANANTYIGSDTGGSWALNFQSNNNIAPSSNSHSWNRSGSNIHPWSTGTANVNQLQIYEISTDEVNLTFDKPGSATDDITVNVKDGSGNAIPGVTATLVSTSCTTFKTGSATALSRTTNSVLAPDAGYANAQNSTIEYTFCVTGLSTAFTYNSADLDVYALNKDGGAQGNTDTDRIWDFNVETGTTEAGVSTFASSTGNNITRVSDLDGDLYHKVWEMSASTEQNASAPLYIKVTLTKTDKDGCYAGIGAIRLYTYIETFATSEVYTINNTNSGRGALIYNPDASMKWVWSSGKSGTFNASAANSQWIICPANNGDEAGDYYLYNVGAQKFAVPTTGGTYNGVCWKFSNDAAPVALAKQSDGTYKIYAPYGDRYMSVSNNYAGPIINVNDAGALFTITKVGDTSEEVTAQVNTALGRLIDNITKLSTTSDFAEEGGWYVIHINSGDWTGHSFYTAEEEMTYNGTNYPVGFYGYGYEHASIASSERLFRITPSGSGYTWQMPNGKYLCNTSNKFPVSTSDATVIGIDKQTAGFRLYHNSRYATAYNLGGHHFIGETSTSTAIFDIYPASLTDAGLVAWQMICDDAPEATQITCNRSDVCGLTAVYKNGYIFLPTGITPEDSDFTLAGATGIDIDSTNKTVTLTYDPNLAIVADGVSVAQGYQTAGRDCEVMLLRVTTTPFKDATDVTLNLNLKDGTEGNISALTLYEASSASPEILSAGNNGAPTKTEVTATSIDGTSTTATLNIGNLTAGTHYYWIGATVKADATLGAVLDAAVTGITYTCNNNESTLDLTDIGDPADRGAMVFNVHTYPFLPWDNGSHVYRIPAMTVADDGSIVVACDKRYNNHTDIGVPAGHVIDIVVRRSTDGGKTWSDPVVIAKGQGASNTDYAGFGDPSLIKGKDGKLYCFFGAGNLGYFNGLNKICMATSSDNGETWDSSEETLPLELVTSGKVTDHANLYGSTTCYGLYDYFVTSGRGLCTSEGYLMGLLPAQAYTDAEKTAHTSNSQDYIFYSTDQGETWHISDNCIFAGGDEAKVIQKNDGSLLASVRQGYNRGFNTATYTKNDDGTLTFTMGTQWNNSQLNAAGSPNNQDIFYYQRATETGLTDVIFHSMTTGNHANLKLYYSTDEGTNWTEFLNVQTKGTRYVTMEKSSAGSLYLLFEDQSLNAAGDNTSSNHYPLNFIEVTREQLVQLIPSLDEDMPDPNAKEVKVVYGMTAHTSYGTLNGLTWTSNEASGFPGLTLVASDGTFNQFSNWNSHYNIAYHPTAADTDAKLTLTAPDGYVISGYSMLLARASSDTHTYTVTGADGASVDVPFASNAFGYATLQQQGLKTKSTVITVSTSDASKWLAIADFAVQLTTAPTPGDIYGEDGVNDTDLQYLVGYLLGTVDGEDINLEAADMTGDGEVTLADLTALVNLLIANSTDANN